MVRPSSRKKSENLPVVELTREKPFKYKCIAVQKSYSKQIPRL